MTKTSTVTPLPEVGERSLVPNPQTQTPTTFTKVDNNLTGIGFFSASSKRSRKAVEKTTIIHDQGIERRISILPSAKYGLPITQDQDFWLALMKLVSDRLQTEGKITNPFTFTTAELRHILGQSNAGKNYKAVGEWLAVMVSTTIEGGAYNVARKTWYTDRTHAVDRIVSVGKELPDGTIADRNHIWFSQWQLDNINAGNLIPIELTVYTQLQNNIAKNLVPHLQEWLFASQRDGRFEKQYQDICQLLSVRVYHYRSDIERQFQPSLDELTTHGYISKWALEPMADRKTYKVIVWHGFKYHTDQKVRLESKQRSKRISANEQEYKPAYEPRPRTPRQKPLLLQPEVNAEHLAGLTSRGVSEPQARKVLADLPAEYPTIDILEWADQQVAAQRGKFTNPPGFYISLLRDRIPVPPTFETSAIKKARQEANLREQEAAQAEDDRQLAEEDAADRQLEQLATEHQDQWQALHDQAKTDVFSQPIMAGKPYGPIHDGAIRARMKKLLAAGWQTPAVSQPEPAPVSIEVVNQATNTSFRQADRLEENVSKAPFELHLKTMLATLQLSPASQLAPAATQPEAVPFPVDEWV